MPRWQISANKTPLWCSHLRLRPVDSPHDSSLFEYTPLKVTIPALIGEEGGGEDGEDEEDEEKEDHSVASAQSTLDHVYARLYPLATYIPLYLSTSTPELPPTRIRHKYFDH
ncbi:hypothetical protein RRF57_012613 [Xylaria bambusicola]|uniref:Uncharacterized protein n=1 Tax=Xylaria bambusicola TaxID=326684 RepID=A0AAN7V1X6_9PEZI